MRQAVGSKHPWLGCIIFTLSTLFTGAGIVSAQLPAIFETDSVVKDVKKRYRLAARDIAKLTPSINSENKDVVKLYATQIAGEQPKYSPDIWLELMTQRQSLEMTSARLTERQRKALRAARSRLEIRMLEQLTEEYLGFLGEWLELDQWAYHDLEQLFDDEIYRKDLLLTQHLSRPTHLTQELERITREISQSITQILTPAQHSEYLRLTRLNKLEA